MSRGIKKPVGDLHFDRYLSRGRDEREIKRLDVGLLGVEIDNCFDAGRLLFFSL